MSWLLYVFLSGKLIGIVELPDVVETYSQCRYVGKELVVPKPHQTLKCVKGKLYEI